MAKINHNNVFRTIHEVIKNAHNHNTVHLYAEDAALTGSSLQIRGKKCWHFATTGYLGLEQDYRLKKAAAEAVMRYGTQFPLSKTYISHPLYAELEDLLQQMFQQEVIICKNSTLAHLGVIPQLIDDDDVVVLDHQVHWSVQHACSVLKTRGIPIELIRHNNLTQLEDVLKKYQNKRQKVWYMADGIYSMYGDHAPIADLKLLMQKYVQLHVYFDDVHGMSWIGTNGTGFVKSHWAVLPENMVLVTTLSKTFGASGAVVLCGAKDKHSQVKNYGGPLTFSAQLEPTAVAAAIASAKIHLTDEIYTLQDALQQRITFTNALFKATTIPLIAFSNTPVFYVGAGLPETAYNLVSRLHQDGFFVNPGIYPAVPMKNAGLRITVSNHNTFDHIKQLVDALQNNYVLALQDTGNTLTQVHRAFKLKPLVEGNDVGTAKKWHLKVTNCIAELPEAVWNALLGKANAFDYEGFKWMEETFSRLPEGHVNAMKFSYYAWYEKTECVALVGIAEALWKEDVLAKPEVSTKLEQIRKTDPFFLCNLAWSTGSSFSEGTHVYVKDDNPELWEEVVNTLSNAFDVAKVEKLIFRDFEHNALLERCFLNKGFVKIEMPESAIFEWKNEEHRNDFKSGLSKRNRRHFATDVLPYMDCYKIKQVQELNNADLTTVYALYLNVKAHNTAINNFTYDTKVFERMNEDNNWSFLLAQLPDTDEIVGCMFCYTNTYNKTFNPILIGMSASVADRLVLYRQLLYHTLQKSNFMGFNKLFLGLSAVFEKKKLGATAYKKYAYIQAKDHFNADLLSVFEN